MKISKYKDLYKRMIAINLISYHSNISISCKTFYFRSYNGNRFYFNNNSYDTEIQYSYYPDIIFSDNKIIYYQREHDNLPEEIFKIGKNYLPHEH